MKPFSIARACALLTAIVFCGTTNASRAELVVSAFSGVSDANDSDLHLHENNGTDMTFHDASFHTHDFGSPLYYGGRVTYYLSRESHWGFGVEFFHSKVYLDTDKSLHVTGTQI